MDPEIIKALRKNKMFTPSPIQASSIPIIKSGQNLIAQSQNGSGKTAAFTIGMLMTVDRSIPHIQALVLCPSRELALQTKSVIDKLGEYVNITTHLIVPNSPDYPETGAQIVCGTPGKTRNMIRRIPTQYMKLFVLDEADVMVDRRQNMSSQITQIRKGFGDRHLQVILFSATFPDIVKRFAQQLTNNASTITVDRDKIALDCIKQFYIICTNEQKIRMLCDLYGSMLIGQSIIFVNTRNNAFRVTKEMEEDGHGVSMLCGSGGASDTMPVEERERVMNIFRSGQARVLVATDVLARGIDVPQVTLVINYDLPKKSYATDDGQDRVDMETYIHRIGRTGRYGLKGVAINFIQQQELPLIEDIKHFYSCNVHELSSDIEKIGEIVQSIRTE